MFRRKLHKTSWSFIWSEYCIIIFWLSYTTYDVYFYEMYYLEYSLFWKLGRVVFDNVKCIVVGMFVMRWWLHTAVWGGHNYAFMADVIVRKIIIIKSVVGFVSVCVRLAKQKTKGRIEKMFGVVVQRVTLCLWTCGVPCCFYEMNVQQLPSVDSRYCSKTKHHFSWAHPSRIVSWVLAIRYCNCHSQGCTIPWSVKRLPHINDPLSVFGVWELLKGFPVLQEICFFLPTSQFAYRRAALLSISHHLQKSLDAGLEMEGISAVVHKPAWGARGLRCSCCLP